MQYQRSEIEELRMMLSNGRSLDDLGNLINYIIALQNKKEGTHFGSISIKQLKHYYANTNFKYRNFEIPKKSGGTRTITAPDEVLKKIQRRLNSALSLFFEPGPIAHGFLEGKSIVTNAKGHIGKMFLLNVDLKDFFPSVHFGRIKAVLQLPIFKVQKKYLSLFGNEVDFPNEKFGLTPEFAQIISNFCCFEGKLPQGAPTSPLITNLVCIRLDNKLLKFAGANDCYITRYADDISVSSWKNKFDEDFQTNLKKLIETEGFTINEKKTRIQNKAMRQEVTGITVNEKLNLSRPYIRKLRASLHRLKSVNGKANENSKAVKDLEFLFETIEFDVDKFTSIVYGKILFLGIVRGKSDPLYLEYKSKLENILKS